MGFKGKLHRGLADVAGARAHGFSGVGVQVSYGPSRNLDATTLLGIQARAYFSPFYLPRPAVLSGFECWVTVVAGAGGVVRLGLYRGDRVIAPPTAIWSKPGSLVLDAGTVDTLAATLRTINVAALTLDPGIYWVVAVPQGAPAPQATFKAMNDHSPLIAGTTSQAIAGLYADAVAGALPDPAPVTNILAPPFVSSAIRLSDWLS